MVIRHQDLEGVNDDLLRPNGVHLNNIGLDIFNLGLQSGIEQTLAVVGRSSVNR